MVELTREETIKVIECCVDEKHCSEECPLWGKNAFCETAIAQNVLRFFMSKKEPAPSGNGTSPEENNSHLDDTTKTVICQAIVYVDDAIQTILEVYEQMSSEEQKAFDLGETYRNMLGAKEALEKLNGGDD